MFLNLIKNHVFPRMSILLKLNVYVYLNILSKCVCHINEFDLYTYLENNSIYNISKILTNMILDIHIYIRKIFLSLKINRLLVDTKKF